MRYYEIKFLEHSKSIAMGNCDRQYNEDYWHADPASHVCQNKCEYFVSYHNDVIHCSYKTEEIKRCQERIDDLNYELNIHEKYLKDLKGLKDE